MEAQGFSGANMAPELTTKVRLVRCPKCRNLLPELPDFQVYKCGGCGAILQAKNRTNGMRSRSASLNETVAQKIGLGHVSEGKKPISSPKASLPESGECSSGKNNERDPSRSLEANECSSSNDKPTFPDSGERFSDQKNENDEVKSSEDQSSSSSHSATLPDSGEFSSDQNNERDQSKSSEGNDVTSSSAPKADSGECFSDQKNDNSEDKSSEDKESRSSSHNASLQDSGESTSDQNNERDQSKSSEGNESSSSIPKATFPDSGECFPDQKNEREQSQSEGNESSRSSLQVTFPDLGECFSDQNKEKIEDKSFEDNVFGSSSHKAILPDSRDCTQTNPRDPDMSSEDCNAEQLEDFNFPKEDQDSQSVRTDSHDFDREKLEVSNEICSSTEFVHNEIKEPLPLTRALSEVSRNDESSPLAETNVEVDINKVINSDFRSSSTVNPGATRGSSSIAIAHFPARESISLDSLVSFPDEQLEEPQISIENGFNQVRSPDTVEHTEFFPSSELSGAPRYTSKSPEHRSYHAYDGSVSSLDGMDDQFSNHFGLNFAHSEERARRDKFLVGRMMNRDSELQHQARDSWSSLSGKSDHAMKYRKEGQDELQQPRRQGHPSRDWNRLQSEEYMSRMAFRRRVFQGGFENGGQTNQMRNNYPRNSGYQSLEKSANAEQDNMTLLRMVRDLQDQVNNLNGKASGRVSGGATWKERHIPQFNNYEASEEERFQNPNYGRYVRSHRAGIHYPPQHHKFTGIPFSSEAPTSRHQVDPSYLHCASREWQCSAPLPQPLRCTNNGLCRLHPGHNCWTSYDKSYASSPGRYVEPDFPHWGRETVSDDLRRHDVKKHFRERHHLAKRHFRPIAGGAPIITCYNCLNPLQVPADFLLFKRRCHKLRCGACSEVLKFSLQKRSHIIPYEQNAMDPPPSEVGDYSAAVNGGFLASTSQDPVSCSDDYGYGLSYCRSCSTEGDPGTLAPSNSLRGNSDGRDTPYSSLDPMRDRNELVLKQSRNKDKHPVETFVSARPSLSSEIEELPQRSSSPLHRLMGYSSPSQVIRGSGSSRTGTSSYSAQR